MDDSSIIHAVNIIIHIFCGSIALLFGMVVILAPKGNKLHKKIGNIFLIFLTIVITTGLIGAIVFRGNTYLLVLTILSGYNGFSGYRIVKTKSNSPKLLDLVVALLSLSLGLYFIDYLKSKELFWNPIVIYSTFGALFLVVFYDLFRYVISPKHYAKMWLFEHIYKMISAFTALLAAAVGTLFPNYQPCSQILPSLFGTILAVWFIIFYYSNNRIERTIKKS